jgi:hypothetical protein
MPATARSPIGTSLLSRFDLTDDEDVRQAEFELRRCATDFDFARWARNWGDAALVLISEVGDRSDWISPAHAAEKAGEAGAEGLVEGKENALEALGDIEATLRAAVKQADNLAEILAGAKARFEAVR